MRPEQWEVFKKAARQEPGAGVPLALIVDSPWIPGYVGAGHLDYYLDPEVWFQANLRIEREFPEAILFPGWWVEYGMAIEPSAFGTRLHFYPDQPPSETAVLFRLEDVERYKPVNPLTDGFMPLALARYRQQKQRVFDAGYTLPVVAARGPLCTAAFVRGVNEFMVDLTESAEAVHRFLQFTTEGIIRWLQAQAEAIGPTVEGILILDDIAGFLSKRLYKEFAHPYLKRICDAFPKEWVKVYHNDANVRPFLDELPDTGFDVLNFSYKVDIDEMWRRTGGKICPMGNVNPLDVGVRGTTEQVKAAARDVLARQQGRALILSVGGGVSPGMPRENIRALIDVARESRA